MSVLTVTLNPAFDLHVTEDGRGKEPTAPAREAGGKGINVSRALLALGVESRAFVLLGSENGEELADRLREDGLSLSSLVVSGRIRENRTLHAVGGGETHAPGRSSLDPRDRMEELRECLFGLTERGDLLLLSGSLPELCDPEGIMDILLDLCARGVRIALDSRSFSADALARLRPSLIKPNAEELSALAGRPIRTRWEALRAAEQLRRRGVGAVLVTRGGEGALLSCDTGSFYARPPKINVRSTVGAGDSSLAGFLAAEAEGRTPAECLRYAVACGSAACLREGTLPPRRQDAEELLNQITVEELYG